MTEQNNILPPDDGSKRKLSDELLMAYLEGRLTAEQQHEVELWLAEEGMESDALEGLHSLNASETTHSVNRLNHKLRKAVVSKQRRRKPLQTQYLTWMAIGLVLLLAVVAYIVIRRSL